MQESSPLAKILALEGMKDLVDSFDSAIKQMKASQKFTDLEKTKLFKQMLGPYLTLLEGWAQNEIRMAAYLRTLHGL